MAARRPPSLVAQVLRAGGRIQYQDGPDGHAAAVAVAGGSAVGRGTTRAAAVADALHRIPGWVARTACGCGQPLRRGAYACDECLWRNRAQVRRISAPLRAHRVKPHLRLLSDGTAIRIKSHTRGSGAVKQHGFPRHNGSSNRSADPYVHRNMIETAAPKPVAQSSIVAVDATDPEAPRTREFQVLLAKMAHVQERLAGLNKRATKKGLPALQFVWGKPYAQETKDDITGEITKIERIPLTLTGDPPKYNGWTFVATLQHLAGENIVRTVPGQALPTVYRNRGPACDHCKLDRRRADTYVVRHDDGRVLQVGRTCLQDFLGSHEAENVAGHATFWADAADVATDGEGGGGWGGRPSAYVLGGYLTLVAAMVRESGWTSRTVARERGGVATADAAWKYAIDPPKGSSKEKVDITAADDAMGQAAADWAEALTDAEVDAGGGDYLHNLRAVARTGMVTQRTSGLAASTVVAYQKAMGLLKKKEAAAQAPKLDAHRGTVGERGRWVLTLDFVTGYDSDYGHITVLKFRDAEGALWVWKASGTPTADDGVAIDRSHVGTIYTVTGTIKKHDEFRGEKQTILSRCTLELGIRTPEDEAREKTAMKTVAALFAAYDGARMARETAWLADVATVGPAVYGTTYDVRYNGMMAAAAIADVVAAYGATAEDPRGQTITRILTKRSTWTGGRATVAYHVRTTVGLNAVLALAKPKKVRAPKAKAATAAAKEPRSNEEEGASPYRTDDHYH